MCGGHDCDGCVYKAAAAADVDDGDVGGYKEGNFHHHHRHRQYIE